MSKPATLAGPGSSLSSALQLLDSFAIRHHNQHRASKWWARFDMLRRSGRRLLAALEVSGGAHSDEAVRQRALWLRDHIIPAAYTSFTQLTADNTFAPLGLFLIGILASINSLLARLLPPQEESPPLNDSSNMEIRSLQAPTSQFGSGEEVDLGVSISRNESQSTRSPAVKRLTEGEDADSADKAAEDGQADMTISSGRSRSAKKKKKRRKDGDEFTDLFSSLA